MTTSVFFEELMQKLASRENDVSEEIKCTFFYIILQVTSIAIVYRPQSNSMQIILNARQTDDSFIIIHNFVWQHFSDDAPA